MSSGASARRQHRFAGAGKPPDRDQDRRRRGDQRCRQLEIGRRRLLGRGAIGLRRERSARRRHLGADRRAHRHQERQRRERVEVLGAPARDEITVENDIGSRLQPAVDEVHQQEGKVVEHVAGRDHRIEFEGVERHRPAIDERDIAEVEVAMPAADETKRSARVQQRTNARKRLAAGRGEALGRGGGKQFGVFLEGGVVLLDIVGKRLDPWRRFDHRRPGVGRSDRAREAVRQRKVDGAVIGETIERLGFVEAAHLDRPFDGLAPARKRQHTIGLARDRDDAEIELRCKRPVGFDLCGTGDFSLFQRGEIQERKAHRALDLVGALPGQKHDGRMGIDTAHASAAVRRRSSQKREHAFLGLLGVAHFNGLPVSTRRTISCRPAISPRAGRTSPRRCEARRLRP